MTLRRGRKQRRKVRAILRYGPEARPKHTSRGGRTGQVWSKRVKR